MQKFEYEEPKLVDLNAYAKATGNMCTGNGSGASGGDGSCNGDGTNAEQGCNSNGTDAVTGCGVGGSVGP